MNALTPSFSIIREPLFPATFSLTLYAALKYAWVADIPETTNSAKRCWRMLRGLFMALKAGQPRLS
jgi:hypothetical protein